jgi:hypothetical protein
MCVSLKSIFSCLDFRGVLVWVIFSSCRVASTLIIRTTNCVKLVLVEEVVEVVVAVVVEMVWTMVA